jgi:hypothetical protein
MAGERPYCFISILIPVTLTRPQHKNYVFYQTKCVDLGGRRIIKKKKLKQLYSWEQTLVPMKWREGRMVPRAGMNAVGRKKGNFIPLPDIKLLLLRQRACSLVT